MLPAVEVDSQDMDDSIPLSFAGEASQWSYMPTLMVAQM
jgi:hypothetical protein